MRVGLTVIEILPSREETRMKDRRIDDCGSPALKFIQVRKQIGGMLIDRKTAGQHYPIEFYHRCDFTDHFPVFRAYPDRPYRSG